MPAQINSRHLNRKDHGTKVALFDFHIKALPDISKHQGGILLATRKLDPLTYLVCSCCKKQIKVALKNNNIGAVVGRVYMQDASHNEDQHHKDVSGNSLLAAILCLAHHHIFVIWWRLFPRKHLLSRYLEGLKRPQTAKQMKPLLK
ncbi:Hypothetical predicted protein [Podarcis lilfordi]|uniref:Uncharacterized protein n=1 Tax=Podarcis lilfordi TaxID=74358 RepID=A0AA35KB76_9SAUR|nr:Hypothetical predicted protein [Podarcis lilfordi]